MKTLLLCIFLLGYSINAFSQAGTLDSSFGINGIVLSEVGSGARGNELAIQSDGKILLAGYAGGLGFEDFVLARYNEDGTPDLLFGNNGTVTINISPDGASDLCYALTLQPDGKIVMAGYANMGPAQTHICLLRLNADGSLDSSFNEDGIVTSGGIIKAHALAMQPDGKILATGVATSTEFGTMRFHGNGSVDSTFGINGVVITDPAGHGGTPYDIALQSDGKMLIVGTAFDSITSSGYEMVLVRYQSDGSLDNSFGSAGIVITSLGNESESAFALLIQPDGKIITTGVKETDQDGDFATLRYNSDGSLDTTFSDDGIDITSVVSDTEGAWDVLLQPDGKIVVAGIAFNISTSMNFALIRFNPDGSKDTSFSDDGIINTDIYQNYNGVFSIAMQNDGKLVVGGTYHNYPSYVDYRFTLARYFGDCIPAVSEFTYISTNDTIQFTSTGSNANSFQWDFGDGNFSSDPNPFHLYAVPGVYEVCLQTSNYCSVDTFCQTITIIATLSDNFAVHHSPLTVYPNPFKSATTIQFSLEKNTYVKMELQDLHGRTLNIVTEGKFSEGSHRITLDHVNIEPGVYLLHLKTNSEIITQKLIILSP